MGEWPRRHGSLQHGSLLDAADRQSAAAPAAPDSFARRAMGVLCLIGLPVCSIALTEFGQFMEVRLEGGPYRKGYTISWLNHSVLIVYLLPWAGIVISEKGWSARALWQAMVDPYGSTKRLLGVTFWLAAQYQIFNYGYWSWLPLVSTSSAQSISQSQCIFVYIFSIFILHEKPSLIKFLLVLLCVAGVCVLTYGDGTGHTADGSSSGSSAAADPTRTGSVLGDLLILLPSACNAFFAVEWKRLVPGTQARVAVGESVILLALPHRLC